MENFEIVVVGGGPAGITLAKMLGSKFNIAIIRPEDHSMIYCAMPYAIEGLVTTEKTFKKDELVTDYGAKLIRASVTNINLDEKELTLDDNSKISYQKLIIATGAYPFIPPIPGNELKGVGVFRTEKDLLWIENLISRGLKNSVVVGAGAIGIELAQALKSKNVNVDLVDMGESVLPNLVDGDMSSELEEEIKKLGIILHLKSKVVELKGDVAVEEVLLDNGHLIKFNKIVTDENLDGIVIFATGTKPNISLVKNSGLEIDRDGIIVNNKMETNIEDVYAVGDCTQFTSAITGEVTPGKLATNAVPMAKVLAFNLLGQNKVYPGFYNGAATKVGRNFVGGTGLSENIARKLGFNIVVGYSKSTTKFPIMPDAKKKTFKLIVDKETHKLLGAEIISGEPVTGRVDLITFAIQKNAVVEELSSLSYSSQPHQSFYPAANIIVLAAEDAIRKLR